MWVGGEATLKHTHKKREKTSVHILLLTECFMSLNLHYNKKTYETYDSNKRKESQKNVVKHFANIFPPDVFFVLCSYPWIESSHRGMTVRCSGRHVKLKNCTPFLEFGIILPVSSFSNFHFDIPLNHSVINVFLPSAGTGQKTIHT